MRIVAGKFRHRILLTNPGVTTRPITDRAKVRLFDKFQFQWANKRVIDVFAGAGTLGFETLSRGAKSVVFIERDHRAHELLKANAAHLQVESQTVCWRADATLCSYKPETTLDVRPYEIIFFDPPFGIAGQLKPGTMLFKALERLGRDEISADRAMLVLRVPANDRPQVPVEWQELEYELELGAMRIEVRRKNRQSQETVNPADKTAENHETLGNTAEELFASDAAAE